MQAHKQIAIAMLENQVFAMVARLHVILRRQNQRIIDIEYMRVSPAYCHHVLELAAQSADQDLHQLVEKLEELYFGEDGLFSRQLEKPPERISTAQADKRPLPVSRKEPPLHASLPNINPMIPEEHDVAYVGRLR